MTLERITKKNIDYAIQIQEELFPGESGRTNFEESMDESSGYEYFLLYEDGAWVIRNKSRDTLSHVVKYFDVSE